MPKLKNPCKHKLDNEACREPAVEHQRFAYLRLCPEHTAAAVGMTPEELKARLELCQSVWVDMEGEDVECERKALKSLPKPFDDLCVEHAIFALAYEVVQLRDAAERKRQKKLKAKRKANKKGLAL